MNIIKTTTAVILGASALFSSAAMAEVHEVQAVGLAI